MKTLIEKWKPVLEYKFKSGKSVPIDKHQECAERLEHIETKYTQAGMKDRLEDLIPFCIGCYAEGDKFGGGALELITELKTNGIIKSK
jgi:hypothetical protein